ncbi:MAG: YfcC family protein [Clostridia bacterium]|nr:YfcC family protein [Clostridia bacterium]MBR6509908.1 YfcC family protein [Clostridia bacterium]
MKKEKAFANISARSFITVAAVLLLILFFCASLSYFIPQGSFERDSNDNIILGTYQESGIKGISFLRVLTAPVRVFGSADGVTIIMISIFLLVMSGIFNLLEKTGGVKSIIMYIMNRLRDKGGPVVCITVLIFMLFGSLFGMFEELVTLLPLIIVFMLSMNMDTMVGLGACLLAACFGFCTAITNPFSVGTAAQYADIPTSSGVWLRIVFFVITYIVLCWFLMIYLKKIEKDPKASLTYEQDQKRRENLSGEFESESVDQNKIFGVYSWFFIIQAVVLLAIACIREISGFAIPILAASFLIAGIVCGFIVSKKLGSVISYFLQGAAAMIPAVIMIAIASSVKLVMEEGGIIDTVLNYVINILDGKSPFVAIILIFFLILFLQLFIGSASAKIFLVMPIILPITNALGISPQLVILTYCMADGFTDVILPTNPVLLIGLSMANVSYFKWLKWTWKLQLLLFGISLFLLLFGVWIGY